MLQFSFDMEQKSFHPLAGNWLCNFWSIHQQSNFRRKSVSIPLRGIGCVTLPFSKPSPQTIRDRSISIGQFFGQKDSQISLKEIFLIAKTLAGRGISIGHTRLCGFQGA
jgi:hypothetical protein